MKVSNVSWHKRGWIFLFLLPFALFADDLNRNLECPIPGKEKLRIFSYNILEGFSHQTDQDRMNRVAEWVKSKSPDIIALQELNSFSSANLSSLAKQWGHPYSAIVKERRGCPVGITSKYPIEVKNKIVRGFWHGVLHVRIKDFDILVTHLNPCTCMGRLVEADKIVNYAKGIKNDKILLMGDLNSHSPFDADYMEEHATEFREKYYGANLVGNEIDYSAIARLLSFPFYDLCYRFVPPERRATFPALIQRHIPKSDIARRRVGERLDFLFGTLAVRKITVEGFIMNGEDTGYLSDHYPIGVDLLY